MNLLKILLGTFALLCLSLSFAEEGHDDHGHDHSKKEKKHSDDDGHAHKKHDDHKGHKDGEKHDDHDDHKGHKDGEKHDDHDDHKGHKDDEKHDDHGAKGGHEGHGDHGGGKAIGKGKAIVEVDEKKGFKLSKEAIKSLKLRLQNVEGDQFHIAKNTLVASKDIKGVYRFRAGFFKLLTAKILKEEKGGYEVKVKGVDFGDQIVINGLGLLRVADIYSTDKAEYGHSH